MMNTAAAQSDEPVEFLRHKSGVHKSRIGAKKIADILLVDDSQMDGKAMAALLRSAFGREIQIRHATSLLRARNMLLERVPDLIVLDDILPPKDRADTSMTFLRQSGYAGQIIVVSGEMTRIRRLMLLQAGASAVVHKDDLNAMSLMEAIFPSDPGPVGDDSAAYQATDVEPEEDPPETEPKP